MALRLRSLRGLSLAAVKAQHAIIAHVRGQEPDAGITSTPAALNDSPSPAPDVCNYCIQWHQHRPEWSRFCRKPVTHELPDGRGFCAEHARTVHGTRAITPPLTAETRVWWEGEEWVRFGDLMVQDRKTVEWNPVTRSYEGGY